MRIKISEGIAYFSFLVSLSRQGGVNRQEKLSDLSVSVVNYILFGTLLGVVIDSALHEDGRNKKTGYSLNCYNR